LNRLRALKQAIAGREGEIASALRADLNKSRFEAYETEIGIVLQEISYAEKHLANWMKPQKTGTPLCSFPGMSRIYSEPYGVVLIMSPWNYPFQLALAPLVGALAAGNCAVVKLSVHAPSAAKAIADLLRECFEPRYVYAISGGREANATLLEQRFDFIFFTGGADAGKTVMSAAARNLTPVSLELGGKSPCVVDETADLKMAAKRIAWGKCINAGQSCVAPDYLLAQRSVKDELMKRIAGNFAAFWGGSPLTNTDYPKIINQKHFDRLCHLIDSGGNVVCGGARNPETLSIAPTIIDGADWDMPIMREEIFGPVLPVLAFDRLEEAAAQVMARQKPLALYLFTASKENEAYFMRSVPFGGGCVNETLMHIVTPYMPFGGVGESGMGGYHGKYGFDAFSHRKSVLKKPRLFEPPVRYAPYSDKNLKIIKAVIR
jgi:aldehyde dehydrogenase (NAD+)